MKKVKNYKKNYFETFKWTSGEPETTFFVLTQSQKSLLALKKIFFFISAFKSPTYRDFMT
jgi:hypothetical protein